MKIAVCPGSYDPITLGHMDIIRRAAGLFDRVLVCLLANGEKSRGMFAPQERLRLASRAVAELDNVTAELYGGLLADYAAHRGACALVKGVRSGTDLDWEMQMAPVNQALCPGLETILLPASPELSWLSSTVAREMIRYRQPLEKYLPSAVVEALREKETQDGQQ